ncbi:MAG: thioredoxin family protein [Patescibacteria group bacterium]|nr:thioredoxin family protein [Patescibacteria group bacterium]
MIKYILAIGVILIAIAGGVYIYNSKESNDTKQQDNYSTTEPLENDTSSKTTQPSVSGAGKFIAYEDYQTSKDSYSDKKVVLFFNAKWCPTCQALNKDINANSDNIPADTVIVSVDYDSNIDLRRQYGVTVQHTLVTVDVEGNQIKKWTGGNTLESVVSQI